MTCRHTPGDLSCSKYGYGVAAPISPNIDDYEILDAKPVGAHLVVKVKYPNCQRCAHEGVKIMVYANTSMIDALKWRQVDPHFRPQAVDKAYTSAPSPIARFPGSDEGWSDAIAFASERASSKVMSR